MKCRPGHLSDDSRNNPHAPLLTGLGTENLDIDAPNADSDAITGCGMPRYRHNDGLNAVWADGHARWVRKGSLQLCQFHFATQNRLQ